MLPLVSTNTMPAFEPELTMPYRVLLGRNPVGMGPNRRPLPLYVTLYTLTMTTLPLTSYVMPDWSVTALDSDSWDTEYHAPTIRSLTNACTPAQILRVGCR